MVTISKYDKKVWESYVSNFERSVLFLKKDSMVKSTKNNNSFVAKKNNSFNSSKNLKKKNLKPEMFIDLHGYTLYSAKKLLQEFISNCYEKNIRNILIITGKGQNNNGVLKKEVPKWFSDKHFNKFLVSFNVAPKYIGGEGALLVRIKNRMKKI